MNKSRKLPSALLTGVVAAALHAQISMAAAVAMTDLRLKMTSLAPDGASDMQGEAWHAVTVGIGTMTCVLLPVRYSATYERGTRVLENHVQARKMYSAVVQTVTGQQPHLLTTLGTQDTADLECYGIKAIGTAREKDVSSLILVYDVGKLPRVSQSAVLLNWDETQHRYTIMKERSNDIAQHLTTAASIANIRRFLA